MSDKEEEPKFKCIVCKKQFANYLEDVITVRIPKLKPRWTHFCYSCFEGIAGDDFLVWLQEEHDKWKT